VINKSEPSRSDSSPPSFVLAAQQLLHALAQSTDADYRHAVLKRLVRKLGESGYPRFLKLLMVVAQSQDERAKRLLSETLAISLRKMDVPSGEMTSWGASSLGLDGAAMSASTLADGLSYAAPRRLFAPIEYLCVWFGQGTQRRRLSAAAFQNALTLLIKLLNCNQSAATLYQNKLDAEARSELEGAFTRVTRERLVQIAELWRQGARPEDIAARAAHL
jgi:hypothetical protein